MTWIKSILIIVVLLTFGFWQQWPEDQLKVVFCDVGQGDGAVVILGTFQAVIDTGPSEKKITECLSESLPFWEKEIEIVFLSHMDKDHAGALGAIKEKYKVGQVIDNPDTNDLVRYGNLSFDILRGSADVAGASSGGKMSTNEQSVVMRLQYQDFSALFTGDIGRQEELALVAQGVLEKTDVLKVAHHGSKNSSSVEFLEAVRPDLAVISVGAKNTYGHPHGDTLLRLDTVGTKVLRTDQSGMMEIITDGKTIWVEE